MPIHTGGHPGNLPWGGTMKKENYWDHMKNKHEVFQNLDGFFKIWRWAYFKNIVNFPIAKGIQMTHPYDLSYCIRACGIWKVFIIANLSM